MKLNRIYRAANNAETELHAGIFFCILYDIILIFEENARVRMFRTVTNAIAPMDSYDIDVINDVKETGEYFYDKNRYLNLSFSKSGSKWIGRVVEEESILVFQAFNKELDYSSSHVFILDK